MRSYDFDSELQKVFINTYSSISPIDWKSWLNISSREEYESTALKLSGLSQVDDLYERVGRETTDSKLLSIDVESLLSSYNGTSPLVICHTSGTSGGHISDLKWYQLSEELVKKLWAPGMQTIFQASGLNSKSSAVIFVPSRIGGDGISTIGKKRLIKLYSSEFSQRLMLSLIRPRFHLLYEYKSANNLEILAKIISMEDIAIVSAPASTILGWADLERLRRGLERSQKYFSGQDDESLKLYNMIASMGISTATVEIQKRLYEVLSEATIVFSISSMTENDWSKIRKFMRWEKGDERYTNLYVGSEIGPFAANIARDDSGLPLDDKMYVFPLTIPVIERKEKREMISRGERRVGRLLVSRTDGYNPVINIDTGDVVTVVDQEGLPKIAGQVLRARFRLKTSVVFPSELKVPKDRIVFVGDYFDVKELEIINPHRILACLANRCKIGGELSILLKLEHDEQPLIMTIPLPQDSECQNVKDIQESIVLCPGGIEIDNAIKRMQLRLETLNKNLVETEIPRSELLKKVRKGKLPKGVLKKWPLYLIVPTSISEN
ncbi:MAG: hypothetical protein ACUVXA_13035 [Candidatus Jordarchaeum sp.]|uniref:hypothetical protein n=1 Tax=Candidatus Jordarchaeum sp. TaxID=2823881 RepID=UPI00404ABC3D